MIWFWHKMLIIAERRYICSRSTFCWASCCWLLSTTAVLVFLSFSKLGFLPFAACLVGASVTTSQLIISIDLILEVKANQFILWKTINILIIFSEVEAPNKSKYGCSQSLFRRSSLAVSTAGQLSYSATWLKWAPLPGGYSATGTTGWLGKNELIGGSATRQLRDSAPRLKSVTERLNEPALAWLGVLRDSRLGTSASLIHLHIPLGDR